MGVTGPKKLILKGRIVFMLNKKIEPEKNSIPIMKNRNTHFLVSYGILVVTPITKSART